MIFVTNIFCENAFYENKAGEVGNGAIDSTKLVSALRWHTDRHTNKKKGVKIRRPFLHVNIVIVSFILEPPVGFEPTTFRLRIEWMHNSRYFTFYPIFNLWETGVRL